MTNIVDYWEGADLRFTPPTDYQIEYFEELGPLQPFVTAAYLFRCEKPLIRDALPASLGHIMFFLSGEGEARFFDGSLRPSRGVSFLGPTSAAVQYAVEGPFHCFGLSLSPLGWEGTPHGSGVDLVDDLADARDFLPDLFTGLIEPLRAIDAAESDIRIAGQKMVDTVAEPFLRMCSPPSPEQQRLAKTVFDWLEASLSPSVDELYENLPMSRRHAQRQVKDMFGASPKYLVRKYRALRVAMQLGQDNLSREQRGAMVDLFFDQSHMIRELRHFVGRTPGGLGDEDGSILNMWLDPENLRELKSTPDTPKG